VPTLTAQAPADILPLVARGQPGAPEECLRRYGDLVWSLVRRLARGSSSAEAEDAAQEIFVDLWRSAARFDPAVASEPAFVVMIARRRLIDRLRRRSRRPAEQALIEGADPSASSSEPAAGAAVIEEARLALDAIRELGAEQQRCVRLAVQQGLTHVQVAEVTGLPLGTVKTHVRRGLIRVREKLEARKGGRA
jgi:RNA polymerase sigma-70 factor (ECF subfamily)